jgi:hypothetical protein
MGLSGLAYGSEYEFKGVCVFVCVSVKACECVWCEGGCVSVGVHGFVWVCMSVCCHLCMWAFVFVGVYACEWVFVCV